jgi:hypothetical protein
VLGLEPATPQKIYAFDPNVISLSFENFFNAELLSNIQNNNLVVKMIKNIINQFELFVDEICSKPLEKNYDLDKPLID